MISFLLGKKYKYLFNRIDENEYFKQIIFSITDFKPLTKEQLYFIRYRLNDKQKQEIIELYNKSMESLSNFIINDLL